uniref:Dorsal inhibitory axon guidance protein n=1 Tax=Xenopus tropicalis TaxID=8364 RepID=A0A803KF21_XENTR
MVGLYAVSAVYEGAGDKRMSLFSCIQLFGFIVIVNHVVCMSMYETKVKPKKSSENSQYDQALWPHQTQGRNHRRSQMSKKDRTLGALPTPALLPSEEAIGSSLWRVAGETGQPSALKQNRDELQTFHLSYNQRVNQQVDIKAKRKKHNRDQKKSSMKDHVRHHRGRGFEVEPSGLLKEDLTFKGPTQYTYLDMFSGGPTAMLPQSTANPMFINEQPTAVLQTARRMRTHVKKGGDVMPTLDMTLFDWTDYEDMKPEIWPSSKKKGKNKENPNNATLSVEEPCDHHLDCLPGSCCDLREHLCKPNNRGLNNKCYDDCMCTEGLRCYAKFHRNQRVTRRKGRCVDPETINKDQGSFISI